MPSRSCFQSAKICSHILTSTVVSLCLLVGETRAQNVEPSKQEGRQWAMLIGCEKYHRANQLRYTVNDVNQLARTLRTWGGYPKECILEITDQASNPRFQPLKSSLEVELPAWLKKPASNDTLIVYFSGHGFRDTDGKMYLAPLDIDPNRPAATGIPVEWFRQQLAECPARFKLLIIDACHAGSQKGNEEGTGVASDELRAQFENIENVVTLASSTAEQPSQIWDEKQQSLYSYWLNQGLKGHADSDSDGKVDIDELNKYVSRTVSRTADARFSRPQTPRRKIGFGIDGAPAVVHLRPQSLTQVLADMAEQLSDAMSERKKSKLGVLEFTNDTKLGELLGADFGQLGKWCAAELERQLIDQGAGQFSVIDSRRLQAALSAQSFSVSDLGSSSALKVLSKRLDGMPAIVQGMLRSRAGHIVHLQCKLCETEGDETLASVGGTAALSESEWAMLGRSVTVKPEDFRPETPPVNGPFRPISATLISKFDERAQGAHPLLDPNCPYRVKIMIGGKERKGVFKGNDMLVPVRRGEVYSIWVENQTGGMALMRLLVDGLNTLPQREVATVNGAAETENSRESKPRDRAHLKPEQFAGTGPYSVTVNDPKGIYTLLVAPRVNLSEARTWQLDPKDSTATSTERGKAWTISGFITETGPAGKLLEFKVVDVGQSIAGRQQFTDQVGLITAAFYSPASGARGGVGTGFGQERQQNLTVGQDVRVGNLRCVINIRYVDADTLQRAQQPPLQGP